MNETDIDNKNLSGGNKFLTNKVNVRQDLSLSEIKFQIETFFAQNL